MGIECEPQTSEQKLLVVNFIQYSMVLHVFNSRDSGSDSESVAILP